MITGEEWRIVPSVPALMVCNAGRVMHTPSTAAMPHGGRRTYGGTPQWGVWSKKDGRFIVVHKGKTHKVARLVAEAFHGPAPFDGAVVMHNDENAANNRSSNLSWGTQKENLNAKSHNEWRSGGRKGNVSEYVADGALL